MGTAIAQWICLRLPSGGPWFKSQVLHLRFVHLKYIVLKDENKQKEAGFGPYLETSDSKAWEQPRITSSNDRFKTHTPILEVFTG